MDSVDLAILKILASNARISWADLGRAVKLSSPAAAERVAKLERQGLITNYAARLNREALGYGVTALVGVDLSHAKHRKAFLKIVEKTPQIIECYHITGDFDYMLKVVCRTAADLDTLLNDVLKGGDAVARTRTMFILGTSKEELFEGGE